MGGRLEGRVAIITGASRGLGEYCAVGYGMEGAKVVVAARTTEEKNKRLPGTIYHTAELVEKAGGEALPVICNVADTTSIQEMVQTVLDKWGRIDILMNNAAIQPPGVNSTIEPKHWELMYKINVHGVYHCIKAVLPAFSAQGSGAVINISSAAVESGTPYGGSKRALEAMTQGLALELSALGISVNSLKPVAAISTPGFMFAQAPRDEQTAQVPDLPPPDSYVEAAILLALQTPETFTGQVLNDAGVIARLASKEDQDRFKALNPDYWTAAMQAE